ncbi:hypothetical protein DS742_27360 [Lacrimispora amygdalina]|uniref:Helix-turn-helix domain-containing protein n=1 Tax=Lacrimispora amygdalina TaxID=253257 RepID=A0A3E2N404_9FIRM|nr:DUF6462 family protein [Clostridium indicum]RFZ75729.1 hypothetical protein DS742_27360 [Clostridium indicum]
MKRKEVLAIPLSDKRLLNITEFQSYSGLGRNSALKLSKEAKCRVKYGKRILIDRKKFDIWCEENSN